MAGAPAELRALHARLLADKSLQFDFTGAQAPRPFHEPAWMKALGHFLAKALETASPVLKVAFWIGVGAAVAAVLFLILREIAGARFARRRRARAARTPPADWRPETWKARALLEDADRLAAQGLYDRAVHLILLRGIEDIEDRRPRLVRPAFTARDIAALEDVPGPARAAFARIARTVEASLFGGRPAGPDAFARCRRAYEAFAFPKAWT